MAELLRLATLALLAVAAGFVEVGVGAAGSASAAGAKPPSTNAENSAIVFTVFSP